MLIRQIPIRNALSNYMYLLACEETLEAIAIDPLDHALCLKVAEELGWSIKTVANTHHHHDHIGGNEPVIAATGAELVAHVEAMQAIPNVDRGLQAGDTLKCGELNLKVMDTPGHTMSHICLYFSGAESESPALFCGDTLFNAGIGRCDLGGAPELMHQTFVEQIFPLADDVRVFPGHDYIENNLGFTLDREPDNQSAQSLRAEFKAGLSAESYVSTIGLEREINVFFRLDQAQVRTGIAVSLNTDERELDDQSTFVGLRRLRDEW
ncbi:MAG: hydroxyacylglutathione hydrolase [SAR86 cluster bacterium]|uniref:Hydroxyacylglutathione hydrolase n=1 Tax=SAR86 cluster bacterium TaxID=2030880 RepID=A0A2A4XCG7_9GAMM|nr:MAG: hydroxyacylglutathione hydrolase [SAR86 cluster bacterium]